jgi:hypothetical protein
VLGGDGYLGLGPEAPAMAEDTPSPAETDDAATAATDDRDRRPPTDDSDNADSHPDEAGDGSDDAPDAGPDDPDSDSVDGGDVADGHGSVGENGTEGGNAGEPAVPADVRRYERFTKIEGATYERANDFLRDRTHITAREWAIARLCTDFRTETGVEMTKIGENLPRLVPFMTDSYTPQAVNQARASFEEKIRKAGATFLYGAMSDFFTAEELDDVMYEATEVAKFLLEVEGADLAVESELAAEDRIQSVMREVHRQSAALRHDDVTCPHCSHTFEPSAENDAEE